MRGREREREGERGRENKGRYVGLVGKGWGNIMIIF